MKGFEDRTDRFSEHGPYTGMTRVFPPASQEAAPAPNYTAQQQQLRNNKTLHPELSLGLGGGPAGPTAY